MKEQEKSTTNENTDDSVKQKVWDYVLMLGWLAQMDPTYPHTEFRPYELPEPLPEPIAG